MNTARLADLLWCMTIALCIESIAKIPLLKKVLTKQPRWAIARKYALYRLTQTFTGIAIKALQKLHAPHIGEGGQIEKAVKTLRGDMQIRYIRQLLSECCYPL